MRLLVLTSDRPRHRALIASLAEIGEVTAFMEAPGKVERSPIQTRYFARVAAAEREVFGDPVGFPTRATVPLPMGALSNCPDALLAERYDRVIVYGSSWIREPLISRLLEQKAVNLHAGIAPEYRGTACNFWAEYDYVTKGCYERSPYMVAHDLPAGGDLGGADVGCTIHYLARGIDSGDILDWALHQRCMGGHFGRDARARTDPFLNGMLAVKAGQERLLEMLPHLNDPDLANYLTHNPYKQDGPYVGKPKRYSRAADFTDAICAEYLARLDDADKIGARR